MQYTYLELITKAIIPMILQLAAIIFVALAITSILLRADAKNKYCKTKIKYAKGIDSISKIV